MTRLLCFLLGHQTVSDRLAVAEGEQAEAAACLDFHDRFGRAPWRGDCFRCGNRPVEGKP